MPIAPAIMPPSETACSDGVDNDNDGDTDCLDSDCVNDDFCQPIAILPPP